MSIGNPVMAVKGTIILGGFCLQLGRFAVVLASLPISTVSVVESFNLRGGGDIFLLFDVSRRGRGRKGLEVGYVVGNWLRWGFFGGGGHIRCCGNGGWWFRPYGEALLSNARSAGPAKRN